MHSEDPTELLLTLRAAASSGPAVAGTKAATLGRLVEAGFAVPEGIVLSTRAAVDALGAEGEETPAAWPAPVEAALAQLAEHFSGTLVAVRSSAVAEDQQGASYAGQYDTVLGVHDLDGLRRAVQTCWASASGDRARAYQAGRGLSGRTPMAVLVQRQVDADVAGVAFSANPVTGDRHEVLVSAVPGLADRMVDGTMEPDEWAVRDSAATPVRVRHQALTAQQAEAVAEAARRIEALLGGPQDVEWAMAGGRLVILQARPITSLPEPPETGLPDGTWLKDVEHYPEPFTPLGASLAGPAVAEGLSSMFAAWGGLLQRMEVRAVAGEFYVRPVPFGGRSGPPPPWWALGILTRVAPPLRRRMRTARRMLRPDVFAGLLSKWEGEWRPEFQREVASSTAVDPGALDDEQVEAHLAAVVDLTCRMLHVHFHLIPLYTVPPHDLVEAGRQLLGWSEREVLDLLAGLSAATSAPAQDLGDLAARIAGQAAARQVVEEGGDDLAVRLTEADAGIGDTYATWCERYAGRSIHDDPGSPTYAERPALLAGLVRQAVAAFDAGEAPPAARAAEIRAAATGRAREELAGRPAGDRARFERALAECVRYWPLREETVASLAEASGLVRRAALEAGRRLVARRAIDTAGDAVYLELDVLRAALTGTEQTDLRASVVRARAERAWVLAHPGPAVHGPAPAGLPDVRGLPRAARRLNSALLWAQPRPAPGRQPETGTLKGSPASPGRYTGPVRIVRTEADFASLRHGDVLVAPTTDPAWSVLFGITGALVTDGGGLLSHAAIVAREHAVPAVVGTGDATRRLRNGELVTVDGGAGEVRRLDGPAHPTNTSNAR